MRQVNSTLGAGAQAAPATIAAPARVLKFGSSILRGTDDLPRVVAELYRHVRKGERIVAVVSAFEGDTDDLIAEAAALGATEESAHAPRYVALGEERAAAALALACDQAGFAVRVLGAEALAFRADGDPQRADPVSVDVAVLGDALAANDVVIVPGFVAFNDRHQPVLLGRGGSDLTAIILASELGLAEATLLKDVDGVYDLDPAKAGEAARRYAQISFDDALEVAGELVQSRALNHARRRGVAIRVGRLGAAEETLIADETRAPEPPRKAAPLRVALAGCGIVGGGVANLLTGHTDDFELAGVLVRDLRKQRAAQTAGAEFVTSLDALLDLEPDVIVDVLSSGDVGLDVTRAALERGVSIVSANKQALADTLVEMQTLAETSGAVLGIGSSVGGGAVVLETLRRIAGEEKIVRIEAVVNGTVNYILSELAKGKDFDASVKAAQLAGFAEADPTADLSGADAVAKAKILSVEAFGRTIEGPVETEVLDEAMLARMARESGVWRQITSVALTGSGAPTARVAYRNLDGAHPLYDLQGERNAIRIETEGGGVITVKGRGAGAVPTAHSILGDLGVIRRRHG
ncbi:MAG: Gfo/Idh/MocA family oxidoreductase [Pseudomonadota bacterium]